MPKVIFESKDGPPLVASAAPGTRLADLCDETNAPIPFSCRGASCGTCRMDVLEGMALLDSPADEELDLLDILGDNPKTRRLACQSKLRDDAGSDLTLRVRAADEV